MDKSQEVCGHGTLTTSGGYLNVEQLFAKIRELEARLNNLEKPA